jgi:hypothetical protein
MNERDRRSSQLELVGILRSLYGGELGRFHNHLVACWLGYRKGRDAEDEL